MDPVNLEIWLAIDAKLDELLAWKREIETAIAEIQAKGPMGLMALMNAKR